MTDTTSGPGRGLVVFYASLTMLGGVFESFRVFLIGRASMGIIGATVILGALAQGVLWVAVGLTLIKRHPKATTLVWVLVAFQALGTVARGFIPLDILALGLNATFAFWYGRAVRRESLSAGDSGRKRAG